MIKPPISKTKAFLFAISYALAFILTLAIVSAIAIGIVLSNPITITVITVSIVLICLLIYITHKIYIEDQRRFGQEIKNSVNNQCKEENL